MNATTQDHITSAIDNLNYEGYTVQAEAVEALRNRAAQLAEDVVTLRRAVREKQAIIDSMSNTIARNRKELS